MPYHWVAYLVHSPFWETIFYSLTAWFDSILTRTWHRTVQYLLDTIRLSWHLSMMGRPLWSKLFTCAWCLLLTDRQEVVNDTRWVSCRHGWGLHILLDHHSSWSLVLRAPSFCVYNGSQPALCLIRLNRVFPFHPLSINSFWLRSCFLYLSPLGPRYPTSLAWFSPCSPTTSAETSGRSRILLCRLQYGNW